MVVSLASMAVPAEGTNFMAWWRIRYFHGNFWFVWPNGFWEELPPEWFDAMQGLAAAEPEMMAYIMAQSQVIGPDGYWPQVPGPWAPTWHIQSQTWLLSRTEPDRRLVWVAEPEDMDHLAPQPTSGGQWWAGWQDGWQSGWHSCGWQGPGQGQWRSKSPAPPPGPPNPNRYMYRGRGSQKKREERRKYEQAGQPVPEHLRPQAQRLNKAAKQQMFLIHERARRMAEAQSQEEIQKLAEELLALQQKEAAALESLRKAKQCNGTTEPAEAKEEEPVEAKEEPAEKVPKPYIGKNRAPSIDRKGTPAQAAKHTLGKVPEQGTEAKDEEMPQIEEDNWLESSSSEGRKKRHRSKRPGKKPAPVPEEGKKEDGPDMDPPDKKDPGAPSAPQPAQGTATTAVQPPVPATTPAQPAQGSKPSVQGNELPPPGKEAWKDVHAQLNKLAKAGDTRLRSAWEKANQAGGQKAKRDFYYNVFLLDPQVAKKSVHKQSLERLQEKDLVSRSWLTKFQVAKLQGADPQDPQFAMLADLAVQGLEERPHEVPAWAEKGIKQYRCTKEMGQELVKIRESRTTASQEVDQMNNEEFLQAEQALQAVPETRQVVLGSKRGQPKPEEGNPKTEELPEEYTAAHKSLKRAVAALSSALDRASLLKESLSQATSSPQQQNSCRELEQVVTQFTSTKAGWQQQLAGLSESLTTAQDKPEEGKQEIENVLKLKASCEEDSKKLSKAVAPHKLWAKNQGLI
eukprot:Skav232718  [mRNA]  locus=scaffold4051:112161:115811:- [translate_table: standard]